MHEGKVRLDALLAQRGLFASRSRAAAAVMAGDVRLGGPDGPRAAKPGQLLLADAELTVTAAPPFVSRGGVKLANALDALGLDVAGRRALDVGASTGGFTDCLLQRGAAHVVAVDVAYGELDWSLRTDSRVSVVERTNARALAPADLPFAPDLVVADVSFISLTKVLPAVLGCLAPAWDGLVMVKPQFEVGRARLGKGRGRALGGAAARGARDGRGRGRRRRPRVRVLRAARAEGEPRDVPAARGAGARGCADAAGIAAAALGAEPADSGSDSGSGSDEAVA